MGVAGSLLGRAGRRAQSAETYVYDAADNLTSRTKDGVTTTFTYDGADQLLSEVRPGYAASYTYDANGNRLTRTLNGTPESYAYDDADRILSAGTRTYAHDGAGRMTSVTVPGVGTTTVTYDAEGRATQISRPGVTASTFSYNGLSARVSQSGASGTRTYRRDGADVLAPVIADGSATYVPGVSERRSGSTRALHLDRLGSAHRQTDSAGTLAASVQRDAFGGAVAGGFGTWRGPYAFAGAWGYEEDGDTGLVHVGHRLYDPSLGRFLTQDPIKDGRNWYAYCDSNPLRYIDPTGLVNWDEINEGKTEDTKSPAVWPYDYKQPIGPNYRFDLRFGALPLWDGNRLLPSVPRGLPFRSPFDNYVLPVVGIGGGVNFGRGFGFGAGYSPIGGDLSAGINFPVGNATGGIKLGPGGKATLTIGVPF